MYEAYFCAKIIVFNQNIKTAKDKKNENICLHISRSWVQLTTSSNQEHLLEIYANALTLNF